MRFLCEYGTVRQEGKKKTKLLHFDSVYFFHHKIHQLHKTLDQNRQSSKNRLKTEISL